MDSIIVLVLILIVVTIPSFIIQRKQRRQMEQIRQLQDNLTIGDRVVTTAGLHATVRGIDETTVELETSEGVISTWEKFAIIRNLTETNAAPEANTVPVEVQATEEEPQKAVEQPEEKS